MPPLETQIPEHTSSNRSAHTAVPNHNNAPLIRIDGTVTWPDIVTFIMALGSIIYTWRKNGRTRVLSDFDGSVMPNVRQTIELLEEQDSRLRSLHAGSDLTLTDLFGAFLNEYEGWARKFDHELIRTSSAYRVWRRRHKKVAGLDQPEASSDALFEFGNRLELLDIHDAAALRTTIGELRQLLADTIVDVENFFVPVEKKIG